MRSFIQHFIPISALVGVATFLVATPVKAQSIQFTLNPTSQSYTTAQTATWSAIFLNTGTSTLTFTGISFTGLPAGLTTDDTLYFTNLDATTLGVGASVTANIFTSTAPTITPGTYDATVQVSYRFTGAPADSTESALFTSIITAAAIPEPTTLGLCALGLTGVIGVRRKKK
jgi:PEP-CTERM motif